MLVNLSARAGAKYLPTRARVGEVSTVTRIESVSLRKGLVGKPHQISVMSDRSTWRMRKQRIPLVTEPNEILLAERVTVPRKICEM